MPISGIADYTGYDPDYIPDKPGDVLEKDDFLKLIVAQLEYQDPLEPLDSGEFMTQMSAMGQLEQIQNLNANFEEMMTSQNLVYASQLIGQTVKAIDQSTRSVIEDTVGQVSVIDDEVQIQVGNTMVPLKDVISVNPWTSSTSILQASQMIGLKVTATDPNDVFGFKTISGVVEEASFFNGEARLRFTDKDSGYSYDVGLADIVSVARSDETSGDESADKEDTADEGSGQSEEESQ